MALLVDWVARDLAGKTLDRQEFLHTTNLPPFGIKEMWVTLDGARIRLLVDPTKGETVKAFTRRSVNINNPGATQDPGGTVVLEICPDPDRPDRFVRLYIGKEIVLSTEDLYG